MTLLGNTKSWSGPRFFFWTKVVLFLQISSQTATSETIPVYNHSKHSTIYTEKIESRSPQKWSKKELITSDLILDKLNRSLNPDHELNLLKNLISCATLLVMPSVIPFSPNAIYESIPGYYENYRNKSFSHIEKVDWSH